MSNRFKPRKEGVKPKENVKKPNSFRVCHITGEGKMKCRTFERAQPRVTKNRGVKTRRPNAKTTTGRTTPRRPGAAKKFTHGPQDPRRRSPRGIHGRRKR